jgi:hypothetical protein
MAVPRQAQTHPITILFHSNPLAGFEAPADRFGHARTAGSLIGECFHDSGGVAALVSNNILHVHVTLRLLQVELSLVHRVSHGRPVTHVRRVNLGCHNHRALQVDRVLRLLVWVGRTFFPLCDATVDSGSNPMPG